MIATILPWIAMIHCTAQPTLPAHQGPKVTLESIVEGIAENASRFDNFEATIDREIHSYGSPEDPSKLVFERKLTTEVVRQGKLYRFKEGGREALPVEGKTLILRAEASFDGETTRLVNGVVDGDKRPIANLIEGDRGISNIWDFPSRPLRRSRIDVPLSVYLLAGKALQEHPSAGIWKERFRVENAYIGDEAVGQLMCHKVRSFNTSRTDTAPISIRYLWIAPTRNYQVVREEYFFLRASETLPMSVIVADKFLEVEPGTWFSTGSTITLYGEDSLRGGQARIRETDKEVVRDIKTRVSHDRAFFSRMTIPDGTIVHEIDAHGKPRGEFIQGRSDAIN